MMKVACVLLLLGVASAAFGPAATGSAGSATGGATGGSPPQCHMQVGRRNRVRCSFLPWLHGSLSRRAMSSGGGAYAHANNQGQGGFAVLILRCAPGSVLISSHRFSALLLPRMVLPGLCRRAAVSASSLAVRGP